MTTSESLNITHCVENMERGGLEHLVLDLIVKQIEQGHHCQVVCLFERGLLARELDALGVPVFACGKRGGPDFRALMRLRRFVREHDTDVLHTHNMPAHYYAVAATLGVRPRCLINTRHGMVAAHSDRRESLYKLCMSRTDRVVTVCDAVRRDLKARRGLPDAKMAVVYNGIPLHKFEGRDVPGRTQLLLDLGLPENTALIGSVGRLHRNKAPATLIRAFALMHTRMPDTALLMVGDGALRDELDALVAELGLTARVRLLGDRSDVPELLSTLDLYAMSSFSEGFSIAMLEACASGLPIVTTRVGGNSEIVSDGVSGRLVPAGDPEALAAAMFEILDKPDGARRMGQAGLQWVRENGSVDTMASRYAEIYAQCR